MLGDKDHSAFIKEIAGVTEKIIITQAPSKRGANTDSLSEVAGEYIDNIIIIDSYDEAYMELISSDSPACVTGSLYLIGALKPLTL